VLYILGALDILVTNGRGIVTICATGPESLAFFLGEISMVTRMESLLMVLITSYENGYYENISIPMYPFKETRGKLPSLHHIQSVLARFEVNMLVRRPEHHARMSALRV